MTIGRGKVWVLAIVSVLLLALLAYAWIDGGLEPVRSIAVAVPVPERAP